MRKLSILIAVLFIYFSVTQIFAQKKAKPRQVIVVEISVPNFESADRREFLLNRTPKTKYEESGGGGIGSGSIIGYGCGDCSPEEFAKLNQQALVKNKELVKTNQKNPSYAFTARAFRINNNKSNLSFEILVKENCKSRKIFEIYRNHKNKFQLKCGVSLTAYYGFESEERN